MRTATAILKGISPYQQNKVVTAPKQEKETADAYEHRTWRERCHVDKDGKVFMPPTAFKKAMENAAKFLSLQIPGRGKATYTKHFRSGLLITEPLDLDIEKEKIEGRWVHVPSDGKSGGGSRVWKCFPTVEKWEGQITCHVLDETIPKDIFEKVLEEAGKFIGVGLFRPERGGYHGRFEVKKVEWEE